MLTDTRAWEIRVKRTVGSLSIAYEKLLRRRMTGCASVCDRVSPSVCHQNRKVDPLPQHAITMG